ncbi:hypothetical protein LTS07_000163 [Exophiala sideris]|uniref:Uncharacterized protein n=1 Tax=Exophiala sideris TaxID=1016849 RepID=A0ABR0JQ00_9EURO|nr:hypothetical protein LTS07_000163 [Exophiala sideris]KAK5041220.1 hypothetical protein LTR13_002695 [Exophiala sideris]KAK5068045.1 hypothetical protein LTR69_000163 [Exophiala sideris]KAK5187347.1 hypothetical protein LTR44_000163 [Eurotiomycetes sp. CCFEE 6388]
MFLTWADLLPIRTRTRKLEGKVLELRAKNDDLKDQLARSRPCLDAKGIRAALDNDPLRYDKQIFDATLPPSWLDILSMLEQKERDAGTAEETRAAKEFRKKVEEEFEAVKEKCNNLHRAALRKSGFKDQSSDYINAQDQENRDWRDSLKYLLPEVSRYNDIDMIKSRFEYPSVICDQACLGNAQKWLQEMRLGCKGYYNDQLPASALFLAAAPHPHRVSHTLLACFVTTTIYCKAIGRYHIPYLETLLFNLERSPERRSQSFAPKLTIFVLRVFELLGMVFGPQEQNNGRTESLHSILKKLIPSLDSVNLFSRILLKRVSEGFDKGFDHAISIREELLKEAKDARLNLGLSACVVFLDETTCAVVANPDYRLKDVAEVEVFPRTAIARTLGYGDYLMCVRGYPKVGEEIRATGPPILISLGTDMKWTAVESTSQA